MKRFISLACILSAVLFVSCENRTQKRIVSETPIKTEILGLKLCEVTDEEEVEYALGEATDKFFHTIVEEIGAGTCIRAFSMTLFGYNQDPFIYGGLTWHYVDIFINDREEIVKINITASFESVDRAKDQFDAATIILSNKYGKPNVNEVGQANFWTDNINSVGVHYEESNTINGDNRSFCWIYYTNIELAEELQEKNQPDV